MTVAVNHTSLVCLKSVIGSKEGALCKKSRAGCARYSSVTSVETTVLESIYLLTKLLREATSCGTS